SGCTGVQYGYYLKDNKSYPISSIQNCSLGNSTGCTLCNTGYYVKDPHTCNLCSNAMTNCSTCSSGTSCTKCNSSAYYLSNHTCHACTSLSGCTLCNSSLSG
ncbi:hypothetical protein IJ670_04035, partial [bacterium]|nr:hypothetical protein [bacterium]